WGFNDAGQSTVPAGLTGVAAIAAGIRHSVAIINAPPTITTQPASKSVIPGQNVTFSALVGGTPPFSYQWKKNGTSISGATNATLTLNNVQPGDAGNFDVVVTNSSGNVSSST